MIKIKPQCLMCKIATRANDTLFRQLIESDDMADEILFENEHWMSILDIAPIIEGWSLIIHRSHISSLSEADHKTYDGLLEMKNKLSNLMSSNYGVRPIFFEHGGGGDRQGGACIDHAHLHVIPFTGNIEVALRMECDLITLDGIWDLPSKANRAGYVYFENANGNAFLCNDQNVRQQLIRYLIAKAIPSKPPWEWREYLRFPEWAGTREKLKVAKLKLCCSMQRFDPTQWKLVRDQIPYLDSGSDKSRFQLLDSSRDLQNFLSAKLVEEAREYQVERNVEELGDLLEVMIALIECHELDVEQFVSLMVEKRKKRGQFRNWWIMKLSDT